MGNLTACCRLAAAGSVCLLFWFAGIVSADNKLAVNKVKGDLSVMVLGSGGPMATATGRASAGYLIFIEGKPRILMDAGGGTFQRLARSGANVKDLDIVLLSHLHIDHMGDLSPIVKTVYFHARGARVAGTMPDGRIAPINFFGPSANGIGFPPFVGADDGVAQYPGSREFVDGHYDKNIGLERYLNVFATAIGGGEFHYITTDVSPAWTVYNPETIYEQDGLVIKAVGVNHGPVPALAFRIEYAGKSIVYSGDTSSRSSTPDGTPLDNGGNMVAISEGADLLIYDTAIMDDAPAALPGDAVFFALHTTPTRIGDVAVQAQVSELLLSHLTPITEPNLAEVKQLIRAQGYHEKMKAARDLMVINLDGHPHKDQNNDEDDD